MMISSRTGSVFQSTLPQGERPNFARIFQRFDSFQSTLPQGERPFNMQSNNYLQAISIHAPARGATDDGIKARTDLYISIHAPARGATVRIDALGDTS